jgi:hypothetical protein
MAKIIREIRKRIYFNYPWTHYFLRIQKSSFCGFLALLAFLLVYEMVLVNIQGRDWSIGLGKVVSQIVYATVTGLIFFFFFQYIPQERKRMALHLNRMNEAYEMVRFINTLLNDLCRFSKKPIGYKIKDHDQIGKLLKAVDTPHADYDTNKSQRHYSEYIDQTIKLIERNNNRLISLNDVLPPEWLVCIDGITKSINDFQLGIQQDISLWNIRTLATKLHTFSQEFYLNYRFQSQKEFEDLYRSEEFEHRELARNPFFIDRYFPIFKEDQD